MAVRNRADGLQHVIRRAAALAGAALCAACAGVGDPFGYSIVAQDKYDFHDCARIKGAQRSLATREKTLSALVDKAEAAPGGFVVGALAYRTELASVRAELRAADRAAQVNQCDALRK
jgi:hypothetical protein